ncbi:MAG: AAA family ATPase [bacterium]|nr:AAA family ATPase [bacterium]
MAFLQPENIPSRNDVPQHLQQVARALRDFLPDEVTVWLERTGDGDGTALRHQFDPERQPAGNDPSEPYLVVLDPAAGIAIMEAPTVPRARRRQLRNRSLRSDQIRAEIAQRAETLRRDLRAGPVRSLPVHHVLAFPQHRREDVQVAEPLCMLTEEDFTPDGLGQALHRHLGTRSLSLDPAEETKARATVKPEITIGGSPESTRAAQAPLFGPPDGAEQVRALDRRQERLARHLGGGYRLIRGVAGSGKTLILTHRAKHFGEHFPDWRILLLCFNRALSAALTAEMKGVDNVHTKTVDRLAAALLKDAGRPAPFERKPNFEARRSDALEIATRLDAGERYDMVLVDEAQDLGESGLDLAWAMLKPERDHFVIALDSAQKVYRRRMNWNPPSTTARGRATVLRINYRNTREILDPALAILRLSTDTNSNDAEADDLDVLVMPEDAVRHGIATAILACADLRAEADFIAAKVQELRRNGAETDHIAVLSGSKELRTQVINRVHDAVDAQRFNDRGAKARGAVRVATPQLLKGLEFRHVIVGGANHVWVADDDEKAQDDQRSRLLYVAMTRATETLTVTYSGEGLMNSFQQLPIWDPGP